MPTVSEPCLGDTKGNPSGDHLAVCFRINLTKPDSVRQPVAFRKLRDICIPEFIKDLTPFLNDTDGPVNELVYTHIPRELKRLSTNTLQSKENR